MLTIKHFCKAQGSLLIHFCNVNKKACSPVYFSHLTRNAVALSNKLRKENTAHVSCMLKGIRFKYRLRYANFGHKHREASWPNKVVYIVLMAGMIFIMGFGLG